MLETAAEMGFDFVDVDADRPDALSLRRKIERNGTKAIVSTHALASGARYSLLTNILKQHQKLRPDVSKIVTAARGASDNLVLLDFVKEKSRNLQLVAFAVGNGGRLSRVLSPVFGAYFTIGSLEAGRETAPGQLTVDEIRETWKMMGVG
jgi:3-dehydroquinate dehydratase type I